MPCALPQKRLSIALAVAAFGAVVATGCGGDDEEVETARLVEVSDAFEADAVDRLTLLGDVHGEIEVRVFAQLPERVREVHVIDGQQVTAGEPLVTLEADLPMSEIGQANAALLAAEAARDQIASDLARIGGLVQRNVLPTSRAEALETQLRSAEAQVAQLRSARRAAGHRHDRTVVRAPADGMVALLAVDEGDMLSPQMPVCAVVRMDRVEVKLEVVEADYVRIEAGMEVTVTPPSLPDVSRTGTVTRVSPVLDALTRTASVDVILDNADHVLRPGMVAEVAIELARRPNVTMVPARAVLMTTRTDTAREGNVFVVEGETARRRLVILGRRYGDRMEIVEGIAAGETVVVMGQHMLRDESRVRVRAAEAAPEPGPPRAEIAPEAAEP
jgi:membrane fusion protein (multidrug efflux system)